MPAHVYFVCSNDTHVSTFMPVVRSLSSRGHESLLVSLDNFYSQGATETARRSGYQSLLVGDMQSPSHGAFYQRSPVWIIRDAINARRSIRKFIEGRRPNVVVVGNDSGVIERLWISEAAAFGCRTVLVQDGHLSHHRPHSGRMRLLSRRYLRNALRVAVKLAGLTAFGPGLYGAGGATVICATGPESAELLGRRAQQGSSVVVTGQPRYDALRGISNSGARSTELVIFTTPWAHAGFGQRAQDAQVDDVIALARKAEAAGFSVVVKPHPREDQRSYGRSESFPLRITSEPPSTLLARSLAAVVGISTVVEEAAIVGCPVLVPSHPGGDLDTASMLPDANVYPRFETAEEATRILLRFSNDHQWRDDMIARQRGSVMRRVEFGGDLAARRIADVISQ
jgi:hypothetical protein